MPDYALETLIDRARRAGGDPVRIQRDTLTADGTKRLAISNDGSITVSLLEVDGTEFTDDEYSMSGNIITWEGSPPADGAAIYIEYSRSLYSDNEILTFLTDSALLVGADLHTHWTVNEDDAIVTDNNAEFINPDNSIPNEKVIMLMVYRAAIILQQEKVAQSADDSISLKDGDTALDTGRGFQAGIKQADAYQTRYDNALKEVRQNRFLGYFRPEDLIIQIPQVPSLPKPFSG